LITFSSIQSVKNIKVIITLKTINIIIINLFGLAVFFLEPPLKNHQSLGMAITTAWLEYIAFTKNKI